MHYKNGRKANAGDVVVGVTHNSEGLLRIGYVLELMPQQGPCNVKLLVVGKGTDHMIGAEKDVPCHRFYNGDILKGIRLSQYLMEIAEDYADCVELVTVTDAYKALKAIEQYSRYDSPYFPAPDLDF